MSSALLPTKTDHHQEFVDSFSWEDVHLLLLRISKLCLTVAVQDVHIRLYYNHRLLCDRSAHLHLFKMFLSGRLTVHQDPPTEGGLRLLRADQDER